jgi:outer membrane protein assembly factor BamB
MMLRRLPALALAAAAALALSGCETMKTWIPSIPAPNFGSWFKSNKLGPLPPLTASASAPVAWQVSIGKATPGFSPVVTPTGVFAATSDGTLVRVDPATGRVVWRINAGQALTAGVGADSTIAVVATGKGDVLAFDPDGKPLWTARVSSEVTAPPAVADGIAVVYSGDGRVFALATADGKTKWVYQRQIPPLVVRNNAGPVAARGGVFVGTPGGRLIALDIATGAVGWDVSVATPKGATELERIADVTSPPVLDDRQVCATAFQGRTACFELIRGTSNWSRDIGSLNGMTRDGKNVYIADDKDAVQALDKATGSSLWKQDALAARRFGGPQLIGDYVGVVDLEGYLHLLATADGAYVGRTATDGSPATATPVAQTGGAIWQSTAGTLISVTAR